MNIIQRKSIGAEPNTKKGSRPGHTRYSIREFTVGFTINPSEIQAQIRTTGTSMATLL